MEKDMQKKFPLQRSQRQTRFTRALAVHTILALFLLIFTRSDRLSGYILAAATTDDAVGSIDDDDRVQRQQRHMVPAQTNGRIFPIEKFIFAAARCSSAMKISSSSQRRFFDA